MQTRKKKGRKFFRPFFVFFNPSRQVFSRYLRPRSGSRIPFFHTAHCRYPRLGHVQYKCNVHKFHKYIECGSPNSPADLVKALFYFHQSNIPHTLFFSLLIKFRVVILSLRWFLPAEKLPPGRFTLFSAAFYSSDPWQRHQGEPSARWPAPPR